MEYFLLKVFIFSHFGPSDAKWSHNKQILGKLMQDWGIYTYERVFIDEYQK